MLPHTQFGYSFNGNGFSSIVLLNRRRQSTSRPFICCNKWLRFVQTTEEDPFPCLICNSHEKTCPTSHACPLILFFSFPPLMNLQLESAVEYVKNEWGMEKDLSFFHICSKSFLSSKPLCLWIYLKGTKQGNVHKSKTSIFPASVIWITWTIWHCYLKNWVKAAPT